MKIKLASRKSALTLVGAILVLAAIGIIMVIVVHLLVSLCRHVIKPVTPPPGKGGNGELVHPAPQVQGLDEAGVLDLPQFVFPAITIPASSLTSDHTIAGVTLSVERSTNLVDWETVLTTNDLSHIFLWSDDTNPPPDRAFYRTKLSFQDSNE